MSFLSKLAVVRVGAATRDGRYELDDVDQSQRGCRGYSARIIGRTKDGRWAGLVTSVLVDAGHTVLLIEHHLDVIKTADHVIDLGPEGGHAGGEVVATGTPEDIAACKASHTGAFLKVHLHA